MSHGGLLRDTSDVGERSARPFQQSVRRGAPAVTFTDPDDGRFIGVQPLDDVRGRRPVPAGTRTACAGIPSRAAAAHRRRRHGSRPRPGGALAGTDLSGVLFPYGDPSSLPDTLEAGGERMSLDWAVSVLIGNRNVARRAVEDACFAL
jgi:hypothetical protein